MNISKSTVNLGCDSNSLRAALNIMKGLGHSKKQTPMSIHGLAKQLYQYTMKFIKKNGSSDLELDQIDDLLQTPQATLQILLALKQNLRIVLPISNYSIGTSSTQKDSSSQDASQPTLINQIKEQDIKIEILETRILESEKNFKNLQLKLLNNIKKLNQQIHDKDIMLQEKQLQLNELREILQEKDEQVESITKVNDKKYKRIRQLEEDLYDLQQQIGVIQQDLIAEKKCSGILENKLKTIIQESLGNSNQQSQKIKKYSSINTFKESQTKKLSEEPKIEYNQNSKILNNTKKEQYLQSIEKLTCELTQAYSRINQLTNNSASQMNTLQKSSKATFVGEKI